MIFLLKKKWDFNKSKIEDKILQISDIDKKKLNYLSDTQVKSILDLKLQRLTAIGFDEIDEELKMLYNTIEKLKNILNKRSSLLEYIKEELIDIKNKYGKERITQFSDQVSNLEIEDVIQHEDIVVTLTNQGYIKRSPLTSVRLQRRGGKGKIGIKTREEDFVTEIFTGNTTSTVLFFSNKGKVFKIKGWKIPEGSNQSKGKSLHNLLPIQSESYISSIMPLPENENEWSKLNIVFITKYGKIRKNNLEDFRNIQSNGKIAMKLDKEDEIVSVKLLKGNEDIMINSYMGKSLRVNSNKIRLFKGRSSKGVKGMSLKNNDKVISLSILNKNLISSNKDEMKSKEEFILTITENGYGKRSSSYEFRETGRGGQGIINISTSKRNGNVSASFPINAEDDIMLVTNKGQMIRVKVSEIRIAGRNTQGVRIFKTAIDEKVVTAVRLTDSNG